VSIQSVPGVRLAGTLTIPRGRGPFPAVVLISGSGPQDRDETLAGHKPFLVLSDYLTRRGIAVLRYDDRGTARSTGDHAAATSQDLARDAEAALRFLAARREVARGKAGLIGHSEGGLIAPMIARQAGFVVLLAAPAQRGDTLLLGQAAAIMRAGGATDEAIRAANRQQEQIFAIIARGGDSATVRQRVRASFLAGLTPEERASMGSMEVLPPGVEAALTPWFRFYLSYDPKPSLRRLTVPALALNGSMDTQVIARDNLPILENLLRAAGNRDFRVVELPGLNHLFQTAPTGAPPEYVQIPETFAPSALQLIGDWILRR
jgi:pimeloyl-ACP methyl ester carboxylesterase